MKNKGVSSVAKDRQKESLSNDAERALTSIQMV